jgi:hypothetical protein
MQESKRLFVDSEAEARYEKLGKRYAPEVNLGSEEMDKEVPPGTKLTDDEAEQRYEELGEMFNS